MRAALLQLLCLNAVAACGTHLFYVEYPDQWPPIERSYVTPRDETRALRIAIIGSNRIDDLGYLIRGPHSLATDLALAGYQVEYYNTVDDPSAVRRDPAYTLVVEYDHETGRRSPHFGAGWIACSLTVGLLPYFDEEYDYILLRIFAPGREGRRFVIRYVRALTYGIIPWMYRPMLYEIHGSYLRIIAKLKDTDPERSVSGMNIQIANLIVSEGLRILAEAPDAGQQSD